MSETPPRIEVRRDMDDATRDGTFGGPRDTHRRFVPGLARYFVNDVEVSQEEAERLAAQWENRDE